MTKKQMRKSAKTARFQLEFFQLMLVTGREEEATTALSKAYEALREIIGEDGE